MGDKLLLEERMTNGKAVGALTRQMYLPTVEEIYQIRGEHVGHKSGKRELCRLIIAHVY